MATHSNARELELDYYVVDVFTETALKGNGLAVVMDTVGLTTERMQAIAREFNLSETTFVERRDATGGRQAKAFAYGSSPRRRNCRLPGIRRWARRAC